MPVALPETLLESTLRVNRDVILAYAAITDDFNPIHVDPEFAKHTALGGVVAHGMLSVGAVWQALRLTLGMTSIESMALDIRFIRPVRQDDDIVAGGSRLADDSGYEIWVRNQRGETVISGRAIVAGHEPPP